MSASLTAHPVAGHGMLLSDGTGSQMILVCPGGAVFVVPAPPTERAVAKRPAGEPSGDPAVA